MNSLIKFISLKLILDLMKMEYRKSEKLVTYFLISGRNLIKDLAVGSADWLLSYDVLEAIWMHIGRQQGRSPQRPQDSRQKGWPEVWTQANQAHTFFSRL